VNILAHTCFVGETGYANHAKNFFRALSKLHNVKIRNFTVGKHWGGYAPNTDIHGPDILEDDKKLLFLQSLWGPDNKIMDFEMYSYSRDFKPDVHIVLETVEHPYFYQDYVGPKIAYTVWESTLLKPEFFNRLKEYDQVWVPTKWQKDCFVAQGLREDKVFIVNEAVGPEFHPKEGSSDNPFSFLIFGRWDYRKSTKELIQAFVDEFSPEESVRLLLSVDNPYSIDGLKTTKERLEKHGFTDSRIKILDFLPRNEYIDYLQKGVLLSCARSEGWNLPLIEALACGAPSIYSNWGAQLEFAKGLGFPVQITGEVAAKTGEGSSFNRDIPGNYCEPNWMDLRKTMRFVYENRDMAKRKALRDSIEVRTFTWEKAAKQADHALSFLQSTQRSFDINLDNGIKVDLKSGPSGTFSFIDKDNNYLEYKTVLDPNHWAKPFKEYFVDWEVKCDNQTIFSLNLKNKPVSIVNESPALGDCIAWFPFVDLFQKKHGCVVNFFSPHIELFQKNYPNINFFPYQTKDEVPFFVRYSLEFLKENTFRKHKRNPQTIGLQEVASDILGVNEKDLKPNLVLPELKKPFEGKYVCIATQSTTLCKYWNHRGGWDKVIEYLKSLGYKVLCIDRYYEFGINGSMQTIPRGAIDKTGDIPLSNRINDLYFCDFFIGLGSGLSWLAWTLNKKVVLISGFSAPTSEFYTPYRVFNDKVCNSCWNDPSHVFNGEWLWCPRNKDFECSKEITFEMVKTKIDEAIKS
jgi:autotransporter strand-loop-strand O-heptosyltransferase